jgi:Lrp/AsnC family transcriptional regulator for asnA, asnC and gidA
MFEIDEIDKKILEMLRRDARRPFTEIASNLGVSDSTIHVRLKKLREEGVIKAYTIDINEELLGKKVCGLAMIDVKLSHLDEVVPKLVSLDNVIKVYETHGVNDLVALIDALDLDDLRNVLMEIRLIENVTSTSLTTILKIWK